MHEFSLALNIVELTCEQAQRHKAREVELVDIEVGTLSGVVVEALQMALQSAVRETLLERARLNLRVVQAVALCRQCQARFPIENFYDPCPDCGAFHAEIIEGKELKIKSMRFC